MSLFFLIPLAIGLATAYIAQKAGSDLAEILSVASVISLLLSLVFAPWQVLSLIMILMVGSEVF